MLVLERSSIGIWKILDVSCEWSAEGVAGRGLYMEDMEDKEDRGRVHNQDDRTCLQSRDHKVDTEGNTEGDTEGRSVEHLVKGEEQVAHGHLA